MRPQPLAGLAGLVDLDVLAAWMDRAGLPAGPFEEVEQLGGGTQNILVRFRRGGRPYVLRRGPRHLRPRSNEVIRREVRVLTALNPAHRPPSTDATLDGTDVPAPRVIAACPDEDVMGGAAFYLMTLVSGFNPSVSLPGPFAADPAMRHEMGLSAARALAALGAVDHHAAGLADFGRPEGFLERQVDRWMSELESYGALAGYPGPRIPGLDKVAGWLAGNRPATWRPGIMHGDYHLANLMYEHDRPRVAAIVDWEMCTIGDPLLDLGWLLATWPDIGLGDPEDLSLAGPLRSWDGLPAPGELVAAYAARGAAAAGRDLSAITWYAVLACFKLGIVLEGTHARALAGKAPMETGDLLHGITLTLFRRAHAFIAAA